MPLFSYFDVQKAIYDVLTGDSTLMALITGVYDFVPEKTEYPYVTLGESSVRDASTATTQGFRLSLKLRVYSRKRGRKEVTTIMQRIYTLLHDTTPLATDHTIVDVRFVYCDIDQQKDGLTYKGMMEFSVLAEVN